MACFDTAFHRTMPRVARLCPSRGAMRPRASTLRLPRPVLRLLMEELGRLDAAAANGRVILAHLGNGASLAAVREGRASTPAWASLPPRDSDGTRTGDLDPGLVYFLGAPADDRRAIPRHGEPRSGLLGVSETSADMRDLLAREASDPRAAEAVALFCYQAKKWIGAFAAAFGGVDTLVFAGGIGEHAPLIRERICDGLGFLGIELHPTRNAKSAPVISPDDGRVKVRVIRTDEDLMIATLVAHVLNLGSIGKA